MKLDNPLKPLSIKNKVRLGPSRDGGYVVYQPSLYDVDVLVTYGVGWEIGFEEEFNKLTGKPVMMFDPYMFVKYIVDFQHVWRLLKAGQLLRIGNYLVFCVSVWNKRNALLRKNIRFINEGLSTKKKDKLNTFASHLLKFNLQDSKILLKIDIECEEYEIFVNDLFLHSLKNVNQLIVEFHLIDKYFDGFSEIIARLNSEFSLVHIHGNNCANNQIVQLKFDDQKTSISDTVELTYVRTSCINIEDITNELILYPIKDLDFPNDPRKADLAIKFH